jgi:hypothetical protein
LQFSLRSMMIAVGLVAVALVVDRFLFHGAVELVK